MDMAIGELWTAYLRACANISSAADHDPGGIESASRRADRLLAELKTHIAPRTLRTLLTDPDTAPQLRALTLSAGYSPQEANITICMLAGLPHPGGDQDPVEPRT